MGDILLITAESDEDEHVSWDEIRKELSEIGGEVGDVFATSSRSWGGPAPTALDTVSIELGITASGHVGIIVSKASVAVGTKITLTFRRPETS